MNTIELQQTLPAVFAGRDSIISDVWHQSLTLKRGEAYLVEAASGTGKSSLCSFEQFGIADKWDTPIAKMSFGQQQRVALVRALCQPFDFIFLDEPISHLDEENGRIMSRILVEEADRQGAGIIVTSIGKHLELNYTKTLKL